MMGLVLAAALMDPAALAAEAARVAGRPVAVDARLALADCDAPLFEVVGARVEVRCAVPAWRVFLPFRTDEAAAMVKPGVVRAQPVAVTPAIRRGDRVVVLVEGEGFTVSMDAVAEGAVQDGRLWVKGANGEGRRMRARLREDGAVVIEG